MRSWQDAQDSLRETLEQSAFESWIAPLRFASSGDGRVVLLAPSKFLRDWVTQPRYLQALREALRDGDPQLPEVVVQVSQGELFGDPVVGAPPSPPKPRRKAPPPAARLGNLVPTYTFKNFVVGSTNELAHAAARAVANNLGRVYNPLFLYGSTGVGKTHLVNAIGHAILERDPLAKVVYLSSEAFVNDLILSLRNHRMDEFKNRYRKVDILIVDDVQFLAGRERTQEEFFHTFNTLHEARRQIVLTSDKFPKEIPELEERLRNRFEWGLTADIQAPDVETRLAIIQQKAELEGFSLSSEVAAYLAEEVAGNVREIEGALKRLGAHAALRSRAEVTMEFAREVLQPILAQRVKDPTIEDVQRVVCDNFGLSLTELKSKRRTQHIVVPRQIAMFLSRKLCNESFPEIGSRFGGRDHSTAIHANKEIANRIANDPALRATLERLEKDLRKRPH